MDYIIYYFLKFKQLFHNHYFFTFNTSFKLIFNTFFLFHNMNYSIKNALTQNHFIRVFKKYTSLTPKESPKI